MGGRRVTRASKELERAVPLFSDFLKMSLGVLGGDGGGGWESGVRKSVDNEPKGPPRKKIIKGNPLARCVNHLRENSRKVQKNCGSKILHWALGGRGEKVTKMREPIGCKRDSNSKAAFLGLYLLRKVGIKKR